MGALSDGGAGNYLKTSTMPTTGVAFSVAIWFKPANNTATMVLMDQFLASDAANHRFETHYRGAVDDAIRFICNGAGGSAQNTDGEAITDTNWHLITIVAAAVDDRIIVLDGDYTNRGSGTGSRTPTAPDTLHFMASDGASSLVDGHIAEVCWWDKALSQAEIESLWASSETGPAPETVGSGNVIANWPLLTITTLNDQTGTNHLTNNDSDITFVAEHPTITGRGAAASFVGTSTLIGF